MSKVSDAASRDASAAECASYSCADPKIRASLRRAASLCGHLMAGDTRALRRGVIARLDGRGVTG